jgi:Flp pilus assembly protein TadG
MGKTSWAKPTPRQGERGSVLAYTVISIFFLFLAIGLAVDLSHLYSVKTELQNAADAAALAGASALLLPDENEIKIATDRALDTLNKNKYNFHKEFKDLVPLPDQRALVTFAVNLDGDYYPEATAEGMDNIRFVKVTTPTAPVNIFFSIPFLGLQRTITTEAVAGLSKPINVWCNFVPIAVVEGASGAGKGWLDTNGDGLKTPADCNPPSDPKISEDLKPPTCDPAKSFCAGCKYKMIAGPGAWEDTSAGNYQALDAGSGAKDLKIGIAGGTTNCITSDDGATFITETEPGRMTGPIAKGLNTRFDIYKVPDCPPVAKCSNFGGNTVVVNGEEKPVEEVFPPDRNIYAGPDPANPKKPPDGFTYPGIWYNDYYNASDGPTNFKAPRKDHQPGAKGRREISMPIIHESEFDAGKDQVKFTRIGKFFLNKFVDEGNNEIYVEFMGYALGAGGFSPGGGTAGPLVVPVLYR